LLAASAVNRVHGGQHRLEGSQRLLLRIGTTMGPRFARNHAVVRAGNRGASSQPAPLGTIGGNPAPGETSACRDDSAWRPMGVRRGARKRTIAGYGQSEMRGCQLLGLTGPAGSALARVGSREQVCGVDVRFVGHSRDGTRGELRRRWTAASKSRIPPSALPATVELQERVLDD